MNVKSIWMDPPGLHYPNSFLLRAGLEPGIPVREAGALTRNAKGYSLQRESLERLFLRSGERGLHIALTGIYPLHYCTKQATVNKLTMTKYTLRGIRHILILTEEYLLYKWISRCNKSYTWPQHTVN